jgi:hypothetical protein
MARPGAGGGASGVSCSCPEGLAESGDTKRGVLGCLAEGGAEDCDTCLAEGGGTCNGAEDCDTCVKDAKDANVGMELLWGVIADVAATESAPEAAGSAWPWFRCSTFSIFWPIVSLPGSCTGVSVSSSCIRRELVVLASRFSTLMALVVIGYMRVGVM